MRAIACAIGICLSLLLSAGCSHVSPAEAAAISTAVAVGASAARRADGDCYTWCAAGTRCNPATGLCDKVPCSELCKPGEVCDDSGPVPRCVPQRELEIHRTDQPPLHPLTPPGYVEEPPKGREVP